MNPRNPFYVLDLAPEATPGDVERQGRKLLGLLELGAERGKTYTCPLGTYPRDATMVREALSVLRDPQRRRKEALIAKLFVPPSGEAKEPLDAPLKDAFLIRFRGL